MSELRRDPLIGRWVIMAPNRVTRPDVYTMPEEVPEDSFDPFLAGNESATPTEILAFRDGHSQPNSPGWRVRVVPNKFPALGVDGALESRGVGLYDYMSGIGAHEVIIESPDRKTNISELPIATVREVLFAYQHRLNDLKRDQRLVYGLVFKNKGAMAGASLDHAHSQLICTPIVPGDIQAELDGAKRHYDWHKRSIFADIVSQEREFADRIVEDTPGFLAFCPYASRFPFETWIVPKEDGSHFETAGRTSIDELGTILKNTLQKLEIALDDPPYNYVIHSAPFNMHYAPHYRWHIEIYPRLSRLAGFECGSGAYINTVLPERAAQFLREIPVPAE